MIFDSMTPPFDEKQGLTFYFGDFGENMKKKLSPILWEQAVIGGSRKTLIK